MTHLRLCPQAKQALSIPTTKQYQWLLNQYAAAQSLAKVKQLQAHTIVSGLPSTHLRSSLVSAYAQCGHIPYARKLFDELHEPGVFLYNNVIKLHVCNGQAYDGLKVFVQMLESGRCLPDSYTYPFVFKACGDLLLAKEGFVIHGRVYKEGLGSQIFVQNSLLAMYMSCGEKETARKVFDWMKERSVVSWNTMISGYLKNCCASEALAVFNLMVDARVQPDCATVVCVLPVCGFRKDLKAGREIHVMVEEKGLGNKIEVRNALIDMYVKCGSMDEARLIFDRMVERDVVTWTTMINGYILDGDVRSAFALLPSMQLANITPNPVTLASLLSAGGSSFNLNDGKSLHSWAIRQKLESEVIVETALIDMYAKSNQIDLSFRVFMRTSRKRTPPWNAILSGYVHNDLAREAVELFKQMQTEEVEPDYATVNSVLPAYAILADLQQANNIHCYLIISGFLSSPVVATGMMDIYSKCGNLESAHNIFNVIPDRDKNKDIILWSVLISGYGMHGDGWNSVALFKQMVLSGVEPNEVTFTSVLNACSHAGLVDDGLSLFKLMLEKCRTAPRADHYACMIDLLGRAGRLNEACDLIQTMPFRPNPTVWGALLGACVIYDDVELGEVAAKELFELEPDNPANYILMAKIYASVRRWDDVENVRNMMNEIGLRKSPAHSQIEGRTMQIC